MSASAPDIRMPSRWPARGGRFSAAARGVVRARFAQYGGPENSADTTAGPPYQLQRQLDASELRMKRLPVYPVAIHLGWIMEVMPCAPSGCSDDLPPPASRLFRAGGVLRRWYRQARAQVGVHSSLSHSTAHLQYWSAWRSKELAGTGKRSLPPGGRPSRTFGATLTGGSPHRRPDRPDLALAVEKVRPPNDRKRRVV